MLSACKCIALLSLAFCLGAIGYGSLSVSRHTTSDLDALSAAAAALPDRVDARLALLQAAVLQEVDTQATGIRDDARSQISGALDQFGAITEMVDRRVGDSLSRVDTALSTVAGLRSDLQPILTNVSGVTAKAEDAAAFLLARNGLPAQVLGVTAAAKVTLGQTAQTMRSIQEATPGILATVKRIGDNSDQTTLKTVAAAEESRRLVHNLAENTTPLPKFIRYPAQVIGLLGSAALPVIGIEKLARVDTINSTLVK